MKITLHRALARVKTTTERLNSLIAEIQYGKALLADTYSNKSKTCSRSSKGKEDTEKEIQATWDKFNSLYNELVQLKKAITLSNAGVTPDTDLQRVLVCGKWYTVAEIIALQKVFDLKKSWLKTIKDANANCRQVFEEKMSRVNSKLDDHIETALGSDTKKHDPLMVENLTKIYLEQNEIVFVDPLNLSKKIEELEKEIYDYTVESDAALSEANALRTIELDEVA